MEQIFSVFINFNGNCKEAVDFYANVFGSKPSHTQTFAQMPQDPSFKVTPDFADKILYTDLKIAGSTVMFSDVPPGVEYKPGSNVVLNIISKDRNQAIAWFNALSQGGEVQMPLGETFFSKLYGMLTDKYGINWNVLYKE
jgi:PhnB protein